MDILSHLEGFDWDKGNLTKNQEKHGVSHTECEEIFFNDPLVVREDHAHSNYEKSYFVLGKTDDGRLLFAVFTARGKKVRIISVRDMNRKERKVYEQIEENTGI